jgi:hypothetical protein
MVANMNRIVVSIAAAVSAVLVVFAGGYGYHRDELYFVAAGRHLDWAYADQGPFTPLVARAMSELAPDSLTVLRIPSELAAERHGRLGFMAAIVHPRMLGAFPLGRLRRCPPRVLPF